MLGSVQSEALRADAAQQQAEDLPCGFLKHERHSLDRPAAALRCWGGARPAFLVNLQWAAVRQKSSAAAPIDRSFGCCGALWVDLMQARQMTARYPLRINAPVRMVAKPVPQRLSALLASPLPAQVRKRQTCDDDRRQADSMCID